jgi:hypothetical protein
MAVRIEQPNLLVVEGKDEELFFGAFIKTCGLQGIQVMPIGGKEQLRKNLKALVNTPGFSDITSLGVVRDADSDPKAAFQSVCDALQNANLLIPKCPLKPVGKNPRVAVLILPRGNEHGALEDLCLKAVAQYPALCCVEQYFQCLHQQGVPEPRNLSKAKVQVFLASREEAGKRLGEAAQAGYLPLEHEAFEEVRDFLRQLVSP